MENYSLSDIAAANGGGMGGANSWVLIILFALIFGNGGFGGFGGSRGGEQYATSADVQRSTDFAALERQNNEIMQNTSTTGAGIISAIKDGNFNTLGELRDIQSAVSLGFAEQAKCCCDLKSTMLENRYIASQESSNNTQKILDAISTNRIADMQNQINTLQLQNAVAGVVRYPMASTYNSGANPFCAGSLPCGNM